LTHRALTAALLWAGFPSAVLSIRRYPTSSTFSTCDADNGFVRHGTMLGESC
jgi:hypothetical protein